VRDYIATCTIRYRITAATRVDAEKIARGLITVKRDDTPDAAGTMLLDFALRAKEDDGT
jgi:hypothetical protein